MIADKRQRSETVQENFVMKLNVMKSLDESFICALTLKIDGVNVNRPSLSLFTNSCPSRTRWHGRHVSGGREGVETENREPTPSYQAKETGVGPLLFGLNSLAIPFKSRLIPIKFQ